MRKPPSSFAYNVFINCPIDDLYAPLFQAIVFAIHMVGFRPRCSREVNDSGHSRLERIMRIIGDCKYGIHDISRTQPGKYGLPRFNMPFELGIDLGYRHCGNARCKTKVHLILDTHQYRYQKFISDLSGRDISAHHDSPREVVSIVRDWLRTAIKTNMPSGANLYQLYREFRRNLPEICKRSHLHIDEITFVDYSFVVAEWIKALSKKKHP